MDIKRAETIVATTGNSEYVDMEAKRGETPVIQLWVNEFFSDLDPVQIYMDDSPLGVGYVRLCDWALAMFRMSFTIEFQVHMELETRTEQDWDIWNTVIASILSRNQVKNDDGVLYIDIPVERFADGVSQFVRCIQELCDKCTWEEEIRKYWEK